MWEVNSGVTHSKFTLYALADSNGFGRIALHAGHHARTFIQNDQCHDVRHHILNDGPAGRRATVGSRSFRDPGIHPFDALGMAMRTQDAGISMVLRAVGAPLDEKSLFPQCIQNPPESLVDYGQGLVVHGSAPGKNASSTAGQRATGSRAPAPWKRRHRRLAALVAQLAHCPIRRNIPYMPGCA